METLDQTLNGIARKHGVEPIDDPKPTKRTPDPVHKSLCVACTNGPALVNNLCEPCYRRIHVQGLFDIRDRLFKQLSDLDMKLVRHEAALKGAKLKYAQAEKQNWACAKCKHVFAYYGDLFAHEESKSCQLVRATPTQRRRRSLDEDIA